MLWKRIIPDIALGGGRENQMGWTYCAETDPQNNQKYEEERERVEAIRCDPRARARDSERSGEILTRMKSGMAMMGNLT
jgi:hypothetical protein